MFQSAVLTRRHAYVNRLMSEVRTQIQPLPTVSRSQYDAIFSKGVPVEDFAFSPSRHCGYYHDHRVWCRYVFLFACNRRRQCPVLHIPELLVGQVERDNHSTR